MGIRQDRQALHRIPELDRHLPKTLAYLRDVLSPLKCSLFSPAEGSLCAWFDFGAEKALAFRADMDALPIEEKTGLPFASCHTGLMHACGHDGHMAILLELARRMHDTDHLNHNVLLVFQPAEETTGGAQPICASGVLQRYGVEAMFGLHLWPGLPAGAVASRGGALMCRSCEVTVDIYGRSSHIARAEAGVDALCAGVEFYRRVRQLEASLPDDVPRVLNFGKMESGTVGNAISAHTHLEGSLRVFQEDLFLRLKAQMQEIGDSVAQSTGCRVEINISQGYPAVVNPQALYDTVAKLLPLCTAEKPAMTAEDFSFYQQEVPALFFFLGVGDTAPLHANTFDFDDRVLCCGADLFETLARNFPRV